MDTSTRMLSTTEMAIRYGVTLRSLHFFEQTGLLQPARTESTCFYALKDQLRLEVILKGERLGFSLREIRKLIEHTGGEREQHSVKLVPLHSDELAKQAHEHQAHDHQDSKADLGSATEEHDVAPVQKLAVA